MKNLLTVLTIGVAATAIPAFPQATGTIQSVIHYTVRADRSGDLNAAIKEYNAVLKKAGWDKPYSIWRSSTGPTRIALVSFSDKYAEFDTTRANDPKLKDYSADLTRIATRINASFTQSERVISVMAPDLSLPVPSAIPQMAIVVTLHVKPTMVNDFLKLEKDVVLPAIKAGGGKFYTVSRVRFGGSLNTFTAVVGAGKWADFDGPSALVKGLGDKYPEFQGKVAAMTNDVQYDVYRLDTELSYSPSAK